MRWLSHSRFLVGLSLFCALVLIAGACKRQEALPIIPSGYNGKPVAVDGVSLPARVTGRDVSLGLGNRFEPRFWPGVNLGATVPGHSPGDVAPKRSDYVRWLKAMADLNAHVVRIYTILPPTFYEALEHYNTKNPGRIIYLIQGVWIPEDEFTLSKNAYAPEVSDAFDAELRNALAVVHGDATIKPAAGHASGKYRADISPWLLAWSIGTEWDPGLVLSTNASGQGTARYMGTYIQATAGASPMENWLASATL